MGMGLSSLTCVYEIFNFVFIIFFGRGFPQGWVDGFICVWNSVVVLFCFVLFYFVLFPFRGCCI
ncbi:hypothetical protein GGR50DRAFT_663827, partial [Xylaria sp. CBS 124048]